MYSRAFPLFSQLAHGCFLFLLAVLVPVRAQIGGPTDNLSNDEIIQRVLATRPKGERTLVMPQLFDALADVSSEQSAQTTADGVTAWRDTYGKDGADEFSIRQFFLPLKVWQKKTAADMFDEAKVQLIDTAKTVLLVQRDYTLDGLPCHLFIVRDPASGRIIRTDYLAIYPDLFVLSYTGTESGLKGKNANSFFGGLKTVSIGASPAPGKR